MYELLMVEIYFDGLFVWLVGELVYGVWQVVLMFNVICMWNVICVIVSMVWVIVLVCDYVVWCEVFGCWLIDYFLYVQILVGMWVEFEGVFVLGFEVVYLLGCVEYGVVDLYELVLLCLFMLLVKLWIVKFVVKLCFEVLECFGGVGYIEDIGLLQLLCDVQVYLIWEGIINVLLFDVLCGIGDGFGVLCYVIVGWICEVGDVVVVQVVYVVLDIVSVFFDCQGDWCDVLEVGVCGLVLMLVCCVVVVLFVCQVGWVVV